MKKLRFLIANFIFKIARSLPGWIRDLLATLKRKKLFRYYVYIILAAVLLQTSINLYSTVNDNTEEYLFWEREATKAKAEEARALKSKYKALKELDSLKEKIKHYELSLSEAKIPFLQMQDSLQEIKDSINLLKK